MMKDHFEDRNSDGDFRQRTLTTGSSFAVRLGGSWKASDILSVAGIALVS
jgi:hypothetical protein